MHATDDACGLSIVADGFLLACWLQATTTYAAILTGDQMVPPVNTTAHGEVDFAVHQHKKSKDDFVSYNITLFQVSHLKEIDLRQAQQGQPGDKIAILWGPSDTGLNQVRLPSICHDMPYLTE